MCNSKLEIGHDFGAFLNVCNRVCTSIFPWNEKNCEACLPSCLDRSQQTIKKKKSFYINILEPKTWNPRHLVFPDSEFLCAKDWELRILEKNRMGDSCAGCSVSIQKESEGVGETIKVDLHSHDGWEPDFFEWNAWAQFS